MTKTLQPSQWLHKYLREPVNCLTHLAGSVLSIIGLVVLLVLSKGEPWRVTSFSIYGASLIILYSASTLYHGLKANEHVLKALERLDHIAIFGLIAGSYTPLALVTLQNGESAWGWSFFGIIWGIALLGFVFKIFWMNAPRWLYTSLYLLMGWLSLVAIVPIVKTLAIGGLIWLVIGGLIYSLGAVIYAFKKPNLHKSFGYHELWHLFVLAGSLSHFVMIYNYVLPG